MELLATGIIPDVVHRVKIDDFVVGDSRAEEAFLACSGACDGEIKDPANGGSLHSSELGLASTDHIGGCASLPVRRSCQRNQNPFPGDNVFDLNRVTNRPNMRIVCAHLFSSANASPISQFQSSSLCKRCFRPHTNCEDDDVASMLCARFCIYNNLSPALPEALHSVAEGSIDALVFEVFLHDLRHFGIQRRHDLIEHFHNRDRKSAMPKVLGHFEANKSPADHNSTLGRLFFYPRSNLAAVWNRPYNENPRQIDSIQRWAHGGGTRRKDERVVALPIHAPGCKVIYLYFFRSAIDGDNLVLGTNLNVEAVAE